jgi:putative membrane protein
MSHGGAAWSWPLVAALLAAAAAYAIAAVAVRRRGGWWPVTRAACWYAGTTAALAALAGPVAEAAMHDFTAHMAGHLLLGMAAPVLLVLGAPVTLALRALPVGRARAVSRLLARRPVRLLTHPVTAAVLDAGGLWVLYTTGLHRAMGEHASVYLVVQCHILAAGYLFTAAVIGVDPDPRRPGRGVRAAVLVAFLAAHGILAKHLYARPPAGMPGHAAQLMYYGGDLIHLVVIVVFCAQWYAATDPDRRTAVVRPRIPAARPPRPPWRLPADL